MKLNTKLTGALVALVVTIVSVSQGCQYWSQARSLRAIAERNTALLVEREWKNADNVHFSVQEAVKGSLERGEMEKFTKLLEAQHGVDGLLEFSLFDRSGQATHSSHTNFLKRSLPADLRQRLFSSSERVSRQAGDAFEIYQPKLVARDCVRCHLDWKAGDIGGVTCFRFSTAALERSQGQWAESAAALRKSSVMSAALTTLGILLSTSLLTHWLVKRMVARPLHRLEGQLSRDSDEVFAAAATVAEGSQTLARGASEQAASLQETSASLEEMTSMVRRNADSAGQAKQLADQTRDEADAGCARHGADDGGDERDPSVQLRRGEDR